MKTGEIRKKNPETNERYQNLDSSFTFGDLPYARDESMTNGNVLPTEGWTICMRTDINSGIACLSLGRFFFFYSSSTHQPGSLTRARDSLRPKVLTGGYLLTLGPFVSLMKPCTGLISRGNECWFRSCFFFLHEREEERVR